MGIVLQQTYNVAAGGSQVWDLNQFARPGESVRFDMFDPDRFNVTGNPGTALEFRLLYELWPGVDTTFLDKLALITNPTVRWAMLTPVFGHVGEKITFQNVGGVARNVRVRLYVGPSFVDRMTLFWAWPRMLLTAAFSSVLWHIRNFETARLTGDVFCTGIAGFALDIQIDRYDKAESTAINDVVLSFAASPARGSFSTGANALTEFHPVGNVNVTNITMRGKIEEG